MICGGGGFTRGGLTRGVWAEVEWFEQWMKDEQQWIAKLILGERHLGYEGSVNQEVLFLYYQNVHLFQEMKVKT